MLKTIYVGNLPFSCSETEVRDFFSQHGTVQSIKLIYDRETGKPRGFGFIEIEMEDADDKIQQLNGISFGGRNLRVNEAKRSNETHRPRRTF